MLEIERKFLVQSVPADLTSHPHSDINQGYLALEPERAHVRVRRQRDEGADGDRHQITVKKHEGTVRDEVNVAISAADFEQLWPLTAGRRLHKTRYRIPHGDRVIEVDVFHGANEGLVLGEVEFETEEQCDAFTPPTWFGPEVTHDPAYRNSRLAGE
jgi:CYTH domain-containing protein